MNRLRVFDFDDNTFALDLFELVAQKSAAGPSESGFRVDIAAGSSIPRVAASAGLFRDDAGVGQDIDLQQAFATYVAPLGSGLRIDAGKFVTSHGYEVIDGYDGWNDNASRSFLFGYAIPFTHVGARATYAFSPRVSGQVMLVNGWDVARDNNRSKSVGAQFTLSPAAPLVVLVSGMIGPERAGNDSDSRRLLDVVATWKATSRLTLGANADWAVEENAAGPDQEGRWDGVAGYARIAIGGPVSVSLRAESFRDRDGTRTGTSQTLEEITITPEARVTPHLIVRGDFRVDRSNREVFETRSGSSKTQPTLSVNAIYVF